MEPHSQRLMASLRPGESILWMGRPHGSWFRLQDLVFVGIFAAALWMTFGREGGERSRFDRGRVLLIIAAGAIGGGIALARRLRQEYAVTTERVLIASRFPLPRVTSIELAALDHVTLQPEKDGTGTLTFQESRLGLVPGISSETKPAEAPLPSLERLPDAMNVKDIIERAKRDLDAPRGGTFRR